MATGPADPGGRPAVAKVLAAVLADNPSAHFSTAVVDRAATMARAGTRLVMPAKTSTRGGTGTNRLHAAMRRVMEAVHITPPARPAIKAENAEAPTTKASAGASNRAEAAVSSTVNAGATRAVIIEVMHHATSAIKINVVGARKDDMTAHGSSAAVMRTGLRTMAVRPVLAATRRRARSGSTVNMRSPPR